MNLGQINLFLSEELDNFAEENSPELGKFLELVLLQTAFLQLLNNQIDSNIHEMFQTHIFGTLNIVPQIGNIEQADVDLVLTKSIELVDSIGIMTDPTRTNLH